MKWNLFPDGACSNNGNPLAKAAAACVVVGYDDRNEIVHKRTLDDAVPELQTNNRAEVWAAVIGLRDLARNDDEVVVYTDSNYLYGTMAQGWKMKTNIDLWNLLLAELLGRRVRFEKIVGHTNVQFNIEADKAAVKATRNA